MALGDITLLEESSTMGGRGARLYNAATPTVINAGEPVARALGAVTVTPCATSAGQVGTDYIVGIASTTSTNTATAVGVVNVIPLTNGSTWLISPKTATSWDTQAEYDALVGKRLTLDLTSSTYTINATDASGNGLVVMAMNILEHPGKVAFAFRSALSDLA